MGATSEPGEVFGPYVVHEQLGVGGMATVHRATKRGIAGFEHAIGLKRLLPHLAEDADFVRSFVREAKLAALLQHANIVQIYELGRVGDTYFMAMEYVRGHDIRQLLRRALRQHRRIPVGVAIAILAELCDALDYAHSRTDDTTGEPLGIVHRDVSPSNLIVTPAGHLKVIDFGIAKATSELLCTQTGRVKGKLAYMSPEAINGSTLDARSDIFSAGVVAHELLSVRPLFASKNDYETLRKIHRGEVLPPSTYNPDVPQPLDELVLTALATAPDQRFSGAAALRAALHDVARACDLRATSNDVAGWLESAFGDATEQLDVEIELDTNDIDAELTEIVWGARTPRSQGAVRVPVVPDVIDQIPMLGPLDDAEIARHASAPRGPARSTGRGLTGAPLSAGLAPHIAYGGHEAPPRPPLPLPLPAPQRPRPLTTPARIARGTTSQPLRKLPTNRPPGVPLPATPRKTSERPAVPPPPVAPSTTRLRPVRAAITLAVIALAFWLGFAYARRGIDTPPTPTQQGKVTRLAEPADAIVAVDERPATARAAHVAVDSSPEGLAVAVDGHFLPDATPVELELAPGAYRITIADRGVVLWARDLAVEANTRYVLHPILDAAAAHDRAR